MLQNLCCYSTVPIFDTMPCNFKNWPYLPEADEDDDDAASSFWLQTNQPSLMLPNAGIAVMNLSLLNFVHCKKKSST